MSKKEPLAALSQERSGIYRHAKGGIYKLLFVARHSEELSPMAIYESLNSPSGYWARPMEMWDETVERDGVSVPRFAYLAKDEDALDAMYCFPILNRIAEELSAKEGKGTLPLSHYRKLAREVCIKDGIDWAEEYVSTT